MREQAGGLGKSTKDVSQDSYGGEGAKMETLQVGGGGGRAVCGQLSHIYSMHKCVKLPRTQSQSGEQRP